RARIFGIVLWRRMGLPPCVVISRALQGGLAVGRHVAGFSQVVFQSRQGLGGEVLNGRISAASCFLLEFRDVLFVILHHHLHIGVVKFRPSELCKLIVLGLIGGVQFGG